MQTPSWAHTYHISCRSFPQKTGVNSTTVCHGVWICVAETRHKAKNSGHTENVCMGWFEFKIDFLFTCLNFVKILKLSSGLIRAPCHQYLTWWPKKKSKSLMAEAFLCHQGPSSNSEVAQALTSQCPIQHVSTESRAFYPWSRFLFFPPPALLPSSFLPPSRP